MSSSSSIALSTLLVSVGAAQAQQPPPMYGSGARNRAISPFASVRRSPAPRDTTAQNGQSCKTIDYEGLQEKTQIPSFYGVTATGWVAGISVVAYGLQLGNPAGAHAQFINEPSPVTAAVFLNGQSNDITFAKPVQSAGPPLNTFLGIDDLTFCTSVAIDSVEVTQAIQQIETLAALKTDLANGN